MKKLLSLILVTGCLYPASAQRAWFVYIQAENNQPFYVIMGDQKKQSAGPGYVILAGLADSTYPVHISFPQARWPEQRFSIPVRGRDHGYLLKNFGEKGWGLFDLQTLEVNMSSTTTAGSSSMDFTPKGNSSAFAVLLARVSNDPSLLEKPVDPVTPSQAASREEITEVKQPVDSLSTARITSPVMQDSMKLQASNVPEPSKDNETGSQKPVQTDTFAIKPVETIAAKPAEQQTKAPADTVSGTGALIPGESDKSLDKTEPAYKKSVVTKRSESSTTEGFGLVFLDTWPDGSVDTIRILIPEPKAFSGHLEEQKREEKKFLNISTGQTPAPPAPKPAPGGPSPGYTGKGISLRDGFTLHAV